MLVFRKRSNQNRSILFFRKRLPVKVTMETPAKPFQRNSNPALCPEEPQGNAFLHGRLTFAASRTGTCALAVCLLLQHGCLISPKGWVDVIFLSFYSNPALAPPLNNCIPNRIKHNILT
jgi:hypothetical protein